MRLTKATVTGLVLAAGKSDAIFFDDDIPGFGVRLRAGGKRTWIIQYRVGAKQRRLKLGTVEKLDADKARDAARNRLAQVTLGTDPQKARYEARARAAITVEAVVDRYLAVKAAVLGRRPTSIRQDT